MFEYDVFLSFSAKDTASVKPIWQRLMSSGLRVFWSDENLQAAPGKSFVSTIQHALVNSRDFVLYWTEHAKASPWVEEEYQTFYSQCYLADKSTRRLVVVSPLASAFDTLPPFLRQLQALTSIDRLVSALGGVDINALKAENERLRLRVAELEAQLERAARVSVTQVPHNASTPAPPRSASGPVPAATSSGDAYRLSVRDTSGRTYQLTKVSVKYPGGYGPSDEKRGIRVRIGAAESLLKWSEIMRLQFTSSPNEGKASKAKFAYSVEAALYNGNTLTVALVDDWNMAAGETGLLFGETELGETKIRFNDIDMVIPSQT